MVMITIFQKGMSRPAWGAWIETRYNVNAFFEILSRPAWGAWIETFDACGLHMTARVAPRMGRVD